MSASCPSCDFESLARGPDRGNGRRARLCLWMELLCARVLRAVVLDRGLGRVQHGVSVRCARAMRVRLPQPSAPVTGMDEGAERRLEGHGLVPVLCRCALHARVMAPGRGWLPVRHRAPPAGLVLAWCSACDIRDRGWCGVVRLRRVRRRQQHNRPTVPGPWLHGRALKAR